MVGCTEGGGDAKKSWRGEVQFCGVVRLDGVANPRLGVDIGETPATNSEFCSLLTGVRILLPIGIFEGLVHVGPPVAWCVGGGLGLRCVNGANAGGDPKWFAEGDRRGVCVTAGIEYGDLFAQGLPQLGVALWGPVGVAHRESAGAHPPGVL